MTQRALTILLLLGFAFGSLGHACSQSMHQLEVHSPADGLLTSGPVLIEVEVPIHFEPGSYEIYVDGALTAPDTIDAESAKLTLTGLADGPHTVSVFAMSGVGPWQADVGFSTVTLQSPSECEILNGVECVLPYPSSRFLEHAATETGFRLVYGANTLPAVTRLGVTGPIDPGPFLQNDGFSPTSHALMHFPGGVDLELSDAPRIDPVTRSYDARGLDADSPFLLIEWESGERINHFVENDVRPNAFPPIAAPDRVLTILRPGESLLPGHRYIVAARNLVDPSGQPVQAEPVFAAIRDGAPTDLAAVDDARERLVPVLERLHELGVERGELVLAYDFTVMSDHSLSHEMISMRDQALDWVDHFIDAGIPTFTVDQITDVNPGCADPDIVIWREVRGTFQVPLFLHKDPFTESSEISFLIRNAAGEPVWNTLTSAPYGVSIPCSALASPLPKAILGHGLFGEGPGLVSGIANNPAFAGFDRVAAATNWSGLSSPDFPSFILKIVADPDVFEALPDRLRQGMTNTLVLTRMLERGAFNLDPAFQNASGHGTIDPAGDTTYLGISLGGIMGTFLAAMTSDIVRFNVDVPGINFPLLLHRSTQFTLFEMLQNNLTTDSMAQHILLEASGSLWVRGEPAGYVGHISGNTLPPLPGVPPKQMLVTSALYDQQVSNLGSQLLARSLRIPMLEGSILTGLPGIPDVVGPQPAGWIVYDTGALDITNPAHLPFIPPLGNEQAVQSSCDPHGQRTGIPASVAQLQLFWDAGIIENFCTDDGICNASEPNEINDGAATPCDPVP